MDEAVTKRFFNKVQITPGCWLWTASTRNGYGAFSLGNKKVGYAHRLSFELYKGNIEEGMLVCHSCDNPLCINPDHLFSGSAMANQKDKVMKGRQAKRTSHGRSKLSEQDVADILRLYVWRDPKFCTTALAKRFHVSATTVASILTGKKWKS